MRRYPARTDSKYCTRRRQRHGHTFETLFSMIRSIPRRWDDDRGQYQRKLMPARQAKRAAAIDHKISAIYIRAVSLLNTRIEEIYFDDALSSRDFPSPFSRVHN